MKTMKKALHVLLALAVVCMLTIPAFATTPTYAITISNSNTAVSIDNNLYSAYKLFNVSYNAALTAYSYTWDSTSCLNVTYTIGGTTYKSDDGTLLTWLSDASRTDSEIRDFADFVYDTYINVTPAPSPSGYNTASGESATIDVTTAGAGYYLVYGTGTASDGGTTTVTAAVSLTTTDPTVTIQPKLDAPTIDKFVYENDANGSGNGAWGYVADYSIGDSVPFKLVSHIPSYAAEYDHAYTYIIHDTMDSTLSFNNDIAVYSDSTLATTVNSSNYTITTTGLSGGETFEIAFDSAYIKANPGATLYITYSGTLTSSALIYTNR